MDKYSECTMFQQSFLSFMAADDINYMETIDIRLKALCEAMGVKFKE